MVIFEDATATTERTRALGDLAFTTRGPTPALRDRNNIVRAILWLNALRLVRRLKREDPWLAFGGRVHVRWPTDLFTNASFASHPIRWLSKRKVCLDREVTDGMLLFTLYHELIHIWNYDHNSGFTRWWTGVMSARHGWDFDTAGAQEFPYIAFHEAFSEFAAEELMQEFHDQARPLPYRRGFVATEGGTFTTVAQTERSFFGVLSALRCLTTPDLHRYDFGPASDTSTESAIDWTIGGPNTRTAPLACPNWPAMTIWEILRLFRGRPGSAFPTDQQAGDRDFGIRRFLRRAEALSDGRVQPEVGRMIVQVIDPASTREPRALCRRIETVSIDDRG